MHRLDDLTEEVAALVAPVRGEPLLVIPAAAARSFSRTPEQMAMLAAVIGIVSCSSGLLSSLAFDTPSGPSIVVVAMLIFLASLTVRPLTRAFGSRQVRSS